MSRTRAPPPVLLAAIALAGAAAGASSLAFALTNEAIGNELGEPLIVALLVEWITLAYVIGGAIAWRRRPDSRFGPLMVAAGFAMYLITLSWTSADLSFTVGQALDKLPAVLFLHVFLAFPSGRLRGPFERVLVTAAYATAIGPELVRMLFGDYGPHNLLALTPNEDVYEAVRRVQLLALSAFCLAGVAVIATRMRHAGWPHRRSLALLMDAFAAGLVMIATLYVCLVFGGPVTEIRWATFVMLGLAPVAFLIALLDARLARSAVGDLVLDLREDPAPAELRGALARTLHDPSLELAYWMPEFGSYADLEGRHMELPGPGQARAVTTIERDGRQVAALLHDPALLDERELLDAVAAAAGIALENARLQVELRARLEELRGSRARIVEAGQAERKRLERNLHDGVQQRLVALSLELSLLAKQLDSGPDAKARLEKARGQITTSLVELREVAQGLHPAVVSGHGLGVALEQLALLAPVPVVLTVDVGGRLPEALEVAAYYLVSESLTNMGKHAQASSGTVGVHRRRDLLVIEVADDGVGGADTEGGSGLRGLADRVEALGGRLRVWSPDGDGTRVRAEIPCAS